MPKGVGGESMNNIESQLYGAFARMDAKKKRGRPSTERGAYNALPGRKFGRVSDADWQEIRDACELSGLSLVAWALPMMLAKARREKSKGRKPVADRGKK